MSLKATRPQSARPSTCVRSGPRTNKITLGTYRFHPGSSTLEKVGPVNVHSNVLAVLGLLADDSSPLYQSTQQLKMHRFRAHIPSTVIVGRHSEPLAWYYTNKEGYVLKKHATHCTWKCVREAFCGRYHPTSAARRDDDASSTATNNVQWPVAVAKFKDGRMRLLTLHTLYALLRALDTQCPSETLPSHPFSIQAFVPPAKRVRYISIFTMVRHMMVRHVTDCQVVVAELSANYREQTHDDYDVNLSDDPIEVLESEQSLLVESIKRTTLLLIHHVNRKNTASDAPVISKLIAEYMIHTKDNECYLTSILGVSWQNGDQVQMADWTTGKVQDAAVAAMGNQDNALFEPKAQKAVARQLKSFARGLKGSTELYEAAERHAADCEAAAESYHKQLLEAHAELDALKAQLDTSTAYAETQRKIRWLEGRIELQDKEIAALQTTVAELQAAAADTAATMERERQLFCEAVRDHQGRAHDLTTELATRQAHESHLEGHVTELEGALRAAKTTIEALQVAFDKSKLDAHGLQHDLRAATHQLQRMEVEQDKLQALVPFASVKKVNHCERMHLHDMAMEWHDYRMEIAVINRAIGAHFSLLKHAFAYYSHVKVPLVALNVPLGRTHPLLPHQLNLAQVLACLEECHVITTRLTAAQVDALFVKVTRPRWDKTHHKTTTAGVSVPRGMHFYEFVELLIRIAAVRGGGRTTLVAEHLHVMLEDCLYPNAPWD
ncbi:Aste57867_15195 [Aphanomyces stellatus]|uniref:Aste57867_15195 protein n=1 Tax=Aphanomyces stellatus TaxID=120398 RepID=A0A485L2K4_9STRA|nr:hypothetical protein As57867_015139 [Aphanomyces stellatus]VFT92004.1 Aste57867_15195 [Aphanomyces stellatus]